MIHLQIDAPIKDQPAPPLVRPRNGFVVMRLLIPTQPAVGQSDIFRPVLKPEDGIFRQPVWIDPERCPI